ncbi:hypothetical protein BH10PSE16_BH10PSE16_35040 [soil metagenome]
MWRDTGTWIALGVSGLFIVAGFIMHRVFLKILKTGSNEPSIPSAGQTPAAPAPTPLESHE